MVSYFYVCNGLSLYFLHVFSLHIHNHMCSLDIMDLSYFFFSFILIWYIELFSMNFSNGMRIAISLVPLLLLHSHVLLNKMLWCLQICLEDLKNLLLCVCVLSSSFWLVNSHLVLIQAHLTLNLFWNKCFLKSWEILVSCFSNQPVHSG